MEEVDFHVYAMKEPDYVMSIMCTYGTNQWMGKEMQHEFISGERKNFLSRSDWQPLPLLTLC